MIDKANKAVWENYDIVSKCPYRLNYHIMAPTNWMNDPNGLIQYKGNYHVFYQHHPYSPQWGPMHWGHIISKDLVHWQHKPIALAPDQKYEQGCFSGSAVDDNGILTLIYTAHNDNSTPKEVQCIATSSDGINFEKYSKNPVIDTPPAEGSEDFRDPKVWRHNDKWYMVVATGKDGVGKALLYHSDNLRQWDYAGVVCESDGTQGDIWECPDLFSFEDKDILMVSPINMENGKNIFIIGYMDYTINKFVQLKYQEVDYGYDFYAAQSFKDDKGRRIILGWMDRSNGYPTQKNGWAGALTIPREVLVDNGQVITQPVEELKQLRMDEVLYENTLVEENATGYLNDITGDSLEIKVKFKVTDLSCSKFGVILRASEKNDEKTVLEYDVKAKECIIDKSKSGKLGNKDKTKMQLELQEDNSLEIHIFIDKSSVEAFINNGVAVATNRIYPSKESISYDFFAEGGSVLVEQLSAWKLKNIWN